MASQEETSQGVRSEETRSARTSPALAGRTILVTRTKEQAAEFVKLLEQLGAHVILFPTITIVPPSSWAPCDSAIEHIKEYDAIVFTSANAVEHFFERGEKSGAGFIETVRQQAVYVVGGKTRQAVFQHDVPVVSMPDNFDIKHLTMTLLRTPMQGKRFLFPKGNLAKEVFSFSLRENGATVDEIIVYETVAPSKAECTPIREMLMQGGIDSITFFSPSSVTNFLSLIPEEFPDSVVIAVIGNTTADAARNASLKVSVVAQQSTSAGLAAAIVHFYEQ